MLTVLITTHNGAATLPTVLEAYQCLEPPKGGWKVVLVDNGSTDLTHQIIGSFSHSLPVQYVFEPTRGTNAARNAALKTIEGDLVVFTDDDVVPRSDWLRQLQLTADGHPEFSIFGGKIIPRWEVPPEQWILDYVSLAVAYGITPPMDDGPVHFGYVFGGNMAIRTNIFEAGHRFDVSFGPKAGSYAMGSETSLLFRLTEIGHRAWHCPGAVVEHMIRTSQMSEAWLLSRALRFGRGQMRLAMIKSTFQRSSVGWLPRSMLREFLERSVRLGIAKMQRNHEIEFREKWKLQYLKGKALEYRRSKKITESSESAGIGSETLRKGESSACPTRK